MKLPAGDTDGLGKVFAADGALETGLRRFEVLKTAGVVEWLVGHESGFFPVFIGGGSGGGVTTGCCS